MHTVSEIQIKQSRQRNRELLSCLLHVQTTCYHTFTPISRKVCILSNFALCCFLVIENVGKTHWGPTKRKMMIIKTNKGRGTKLKSQIFQNFQKFDFQLMSQSTIFIPFSRSNIELKIA